MLCDVGVSQTALGFLCSSIKRLYPTYLEQVPFRLGQVTLRAFYVRLLSACIPLTSSGPIQVGPSNAQGFLCSSIKRLYPTYLIRSHSGWAR